MLTSLHPHKAVSFIDMTPSDAYHFLRNTVFYNELMKRARRDNLQCSSDKLPAA